MPDVAKALTASSRKVHGWPGKGSTVLKIKVSEKNTRTLTLKLQALYIKFPCSGK